MTTALLVLGTIIWFGCGILALGIDLAFQWGMWPTLKNRNADLAANSLLVIAGGAYLVSVLLLTGAKFGVRYK